MKRTHTCGELRLNHVGQEVVLNGWVNSVRTHGGLIFVDIRDRSGKTQIVFNAQKNQDAYSVATQMRSEYVIAVKGIVRQREPHTINPGIPTGEIEIEATSAQIINPSKTPPFDLLDTSKVSLDLRLTYRYLDLRSPKMQDNLINYHRVAQAIREFFDREGFIEIETPYMIKNTPGGARNFLVPSRIFPGSFFALSESPQIFKQLLMIAGYDKYYQIARCFRDEDLRADRQIEFTQLDMEMSFVDMDDVLTVIENCLKHVFKKVLGIDIQIPFVRINYHEAMQKWGTDKPDLRFAMSISDITQIVASSNYSLFRSCAASGQVIKGINFKGLAHYSRKDLEELEKFVKSVGAPGLLWLKCEQNELAGSTAKYLSPQEKHQIIQEMQVEDKDLIILIADKEEVALETLSMLRNHIRDKENLVRHDDFKFCWIVNFPLFEFSKQEQKIVARHHLFTAPVDEDIPLLDTNPLKVAAKAYDLVLNGVEIGGGSIRIHDKQVQEKVLKVLGISQEEMRSKFGFFCDALGYGAPPHGGIALGLARLVMVMFGLESIREVIAFPKTHKTQCLMSGAPSDASPEHLKELHIKIEPK